MEHTKLNITKSVGLQIARAKPGKLFSYQDLSDYEEHSHAVIKAISRYSKEWSVVKVKKGLFYRAESGRFGSMAPKTKDIIHYFTSDKSRTVGYVTGPALYYRWGLTTQVPAEVNISTSTLKREKVVISGLRITTTPARFKVTKKNTRVLQFLDVMKNIDRIPDTEIHEVSKKLAVRLADYSPKEIDEMESIAIKAYSERTKALLGSFFEEYLNYYSEKLQHSLNPTSKYRFSYSDKWENATKHWRLIRT